MSVRTKSCKARRGIAIVEFTFSLLFLVPLVLGVFVFGFKLIRSLEMTQVTRDLGAMYLRGVDFRSAGSLQTATTLAASYNLTATGTSVVILSRVRVITSSDCIAANNVAPIVGGSSCTNLGKTVFTEQLVIGNTSVGPSHFGTPPVQPVGCTPISPGTPCSYTVTIFNLGRNSAAQVSSFPMTLNAGEVAYMAEFVNQTPELNIPGLSGAPLVYARAIF